MAIFLAGNRADYLVLRIIAWNTIFFTNLHIEILGASIIWLVGI